MNTTHHRFLKTLQTAVAAALSFLLLLSLPAFADDDTNKTGLNMSINLGGSTAEKSSATNYFGLPKEAFDKLSPAQIMELAKSAQNDPRTISRSIEGIVVPFALFGMIVALVFIGGAQKLKRQRMLHETVRVMIEKGQPIPPDLLKNQDSVRRPGSDLRRGLVCVAVGLAQGIFMFVDHHKDWAPFCLIPLLIGVAFLITWRLEKNKAP